MEADGSAVRVAEVAFDANIGAELAETEALQGKIGCGREMREWHAGVAGEFRCEEERGFVDEIAGKSGAVERGAGLEQDATYFAAREFGDDRGEIDTAAPGACADDFDAGVLQLSGFWGVEFRVREDDEVVVGGFHDAAGGGDAQLGIEHDAQETAAAFESAAIGEEGIVGDDGADAGEERVGRVADAMDCGAGFFGGDPGAIGLARFRRLRFFERELAVER